MMIRDVLMVLASSFLAFFAYAEPLPEVIMHKDPNCGCCGKWAEHLAANGFRVKTVEERDMAVVKRRFGIPAPLASCHTAEVGGYVIEGHVPAATIKRLLQEKPRVAGLSAPGMPVGSPGMETPGMPPQAYEVVAFSRDGRASVFEKIPGAVRAGR